MIRSTLGRTVLLGLLLAASATGSQAQFGLPTLVNDPVATTATVSVRWGVQDTRDELRNHLLAFLYSLGGHSSLPSREIDDVVADLEQFVSDAGGLGYNLSNLEAQFNAIYDRGVFYVEDLLLALDRDLEQLDTALMTVQGTLSSMQGHLDQIEASAVDLVDYQARLEDAGITPTEIEQVVGSIRAYGAQEVQLLRQALMQQVNQSAVVYSAELNAQATAIREDIEGYERAIIAVESVVVPPAPGPVFPGY